MFAQGSRVRSVVAYGSIMPVSQLQRGCSILIATPDMLLHLVEERNVSVSNCKYLVLDDADRMWDGEFMWEIHELVEDPNMPKQAPRGDRQTLIFSTALPDEMQESAQEFLAEDYLFLATNEPCTATWTDPDKDWGADDEDWGEEEGSIQGVLFFSCGFLFHSNAGNIYSNWKAGKFTK